jgi:hypothetical protein
MDRATLKPLLPSGSLILLITTSYSFKELWALSCWKSHNSSEQPCTFRLFWNSPRTRSFHKRIGWTLDLKKVVDIFFTILKILLVYQNQCFDLWRPTLRTRVSLVPFQVPTEHYLINMTFIFEIKGAGSGPQLLYTYHCCFSNFLRHRYLFTYINALLLLLEIMKISHMHTYQ